MQIIVWSVLGMGAILMYLRRPQEPEPEPIDLHPTNTTRRVVKFKIRHVKPVNKETQTTPEWDSPMSETEDIFSFDEDYLKTKIVYKEKTYAN